MLLVHGLLGLFFLFLLTGTRLSHFVLGSMLLVNFLTGVRLVRILICVPLSHSYYVMLLAYLCRAFVHLLIGMRLAQSLPVRRSMPLLGNLPSSGPVLLAGSCNAALASASHRSKRIPSSQPRRPGLAANATRADAQRRRVGAAMTGHTASVSSGVPAIRADAHRRRVGAGMTGHTASVRSGVPAITLRTYCLPSALRLHLDSWGPKMRQVVETTRQRWLHSVGVPACRRLDQLRFRLGTDCSGADAPVWAMKALGISHEHLFSCDTDKHVQAFIKSASPPTTKLFLDMLTRPPGEVPAVDIYVCGFPCTPYSSLRAHNTKWFREPAAKPYFQMLTVLRERRPAFALLENVGGLRRLMDKVLRDLERLKWYYVLWTMIDSEDFGEPVSRPRCYFMLIRRDACVSSDVTEMADFCKQCMLATRAPITQHVKSRLLPNSSEEVQSYLRRKRRDVGLPFRSSGVTAGAHGKWVAKHAAFRRHAGVSEFRSRGVCASLLSPRQTDLVNLMLQTRGQDIVVDVSQSIDRGSCRTNGVCPTITPNGICYVGSLERLVLPCEKLLLHGFPLHRVKIPTGIPDDSLAKMGGNTMHLHSVGLALLMGISLLRDSLPHAPPAQPPAKVARAICVSATCKQSRNARDAQLDGQCGNKRRRLRMSNHSPEFRRSGVQ